MPKSQNRHKALLLLRHHNGATGEIRSALERGGDRRGKRIPDLASVIGFSYKFNAKDRIERGTRRTGRLWRRKLGRRELRRNALRRCSGPRVIACYHSASRCSPTRTARFNSHATLRWSFDPVPPKWVGASSQSRQIKPRPVRGRADAPGGARGDGEYFPAGKDSRLPWGAYSG